MALLNNTKEKGFLMIDVLIGLAVASVLAIAFTGGMLNAVRVSGSQTKALKAELLAVELIEIVRDIEQRASSDPFTVNVMPYYPDIVGGNWALQSGTDTVGGYERSLLVEEVSRDTTTNEIVETGGVVDPDTFKITATVTWLGNTKSLSLETYAYDM